MTDDTILKGLPYAFPFLLAGSWLIVTTLVGFMSGWFNLQQWYPDDGSEEPLLKLDRQSGSMGIGVAINGALKLRAYPSGLGVGLWRVFAPFQRPLKVPWSEIEAEPTTSFFLPMVKLSLGKPANGRLKISARSWSRLVDAVPKSGSSMSIQMPLAMPVSAGSVARAMLIQWALISAVLAAFFYFISRSLDPRNGIPLIACIGCPVFFGIAQLIRYRRES